MTKISSIVSARFVIAAMVMGISSFTAEAAILYGGTEIGDHATIESALTAATDGDEIVLRAGTHNAAAEYIVTSPLTICGNTGRSEVVPCRPRRAAAFSHSRTPLFFRAGGCRFNSARKQSDNTNNLNKRRDYENDQFWYAWKGGIGIGKA